MAVTQDDLRVYLSLLDIDYDRATLLILLAEGQCSAIISPLTDATDAVVLSSAGRAYLNPSGVTTQTAGPYQQTLPSAGVYLTKAERATLRRLAGGSGAYSIDLIAGYPDAQFPDDT